METDMQPTYAVRSFWLAMLFILAVNPAALAQNIAAQDQAAKLHAEAMELLKSTAAEPRREAVKKLDAADELWKQIGDLRKRADGMALLVETLSSLSETKRALECALALLPLTAALGDKTLEGETMTNIGGFYDILGDTRKGLPYVEASAEHFKSVGDAKRQAVALNTAGILYSEVGEMQKAFEQLNHSLVLRRESKDVAGEARTLINIGSVYDDVGEKRRAAAYYEEGLELIPESDPRTRAIALNNLGITLRQLGEYQRAIDTFERSLLLRRKIGDKRGEAITIANIANVYKSLAEFERALDLLNESLVMFRAGGFRRNEAITLSSIGAMHSIMGDTNKALEYHQKALDIDRSIGSKQGQAQDLRGIAALVADLGRPEEAFKLVEEGFKLATAAGDKEEIADFTLLKARTLEQLRRVEEASKTFAEAIDLTRQTEMPYDLAEALYHGARFDHRHNAPELAIQKMAEVLNIIEDIRNSVVAENLRSSFLADQQRYFDFYLSLMAKRHGREPNKGFDAAAFRISERARARSLLESLGAASKEIRSGVPSALTEREASLRQSINAKESQRLSAVRSKNRDSATRLEGEIAGLVNEYRDVQAEMRRQNPQIAALTKPQPLELHEVQANVLDNDSILLEYFLGKDNSWLFIITKGSIEIAELPREEVIDGAARKALDAIRARAANDRRIGSGGRRAPIVADDAELDKLLADLYRTLIAPAAGKIKNKRLLIVGSGVLQYFPFASLRAQSEGRQRYLIETNEIVILPSASVVPLLRQNRTSPRVHKNTISVIADPVFASDDPRVRLASSKGDAASTAVMRDVKYLPPVLRSDLVRLRFSRNEAEAIANLAPDSRSMIALDFAANLTNATGEDVRRSRVVHFATHGVIDSRFPELSGLVFSLYDAEGKPRNGVLRLADIYNLHFDADLVVLSACETALGKEIRGEGLVGLTRGMMFAGASSVAASLWRVEDRATADLMKHFYRSVLKDGLSPAAALRAAQIATAREKGRSHPFYWAGFTLQGEWKPAK